MKVRVKVYIIGYVKSPQEHGMLVSIAGELPECLPEKCMQGYW